MRSLVLPEQPQDVLIRLGGERERRRGQRLARLQRKQARALLVGVGQGQVVGAGLQRIDRLLCEIRAILDDRYVRRIGGRLVLQGGERIVDVGERGVGVEIGLERIVEATMPSPSEVSLMPATTSLVVADWFMITVRFLLFTRLTPL